MKSENTGRIHCHGFLFTALLVCSLTLLPCLYYSQIPDSLLSSHSLKKLSQEELMKIEVTSVSKRPGRLGIFNGEAKIKTAPGKGFELEITMTLIKSSI